jgi:FkbM family methyltransferase
MISFLKNLVSKSPMMTAVARAVRQHKALHIVPSETPWKFKFNGHSGMISGSFEPRETAIFRTCMNQADVFINVGANIGFYCAHALELGKTCVAFEPHPENVAMLLQNLKTNNWKAEVHPVACGSDPDILELYGGGTAASLLKGWAGLSGANPQLVPVIRLDDMVGERFKNHQLLCLIDVEGAELHVLDGAHALLHRHQKPLWIVEICIDEHYATENGRNPVLRQTFSRFFDAGYRAYSIECNLREVTKSEIDEISIGGPNTISGHNFIFTDRGIDWIMASGS